MQDKRQEGSSFCEQKEAKKLYPIERGEGFGDAGYRKHDDGCRRMNEVFLLLFVHKKKTLFATWFFAFGHVIALDAMSIGRHLPNERSDNF